MKKRSFFSNVAYAFSCLNKYGTRFIVSIFVSYIALFVSTIILNYLPSIIVYGISNKIDVINLILIIIGFLVCYLLFNVISNFLLQKTMHI